MAQQPEMLVGLDIGTTKICAVVGERTGNGAVGIVGLGHAPSMGLRKGVVINIDRTTEAIRQAVHEAELMAGCDVSQVYIGIAGGHIQSQNSQGAIILKRREIRASDIGRVIDAARDIEVADDREVLHILPQEYIVDAQDGIREPLGMSGGRLEAKVHIVTGTTTSAENLIRCAQKAGLNVADIVLEPLASSEAVLSPDERELGVALVDIGGGTTDLAIWSDGSIVHTHVFAIGGDHLTNDIALGLRTPSEEAERIKREVGCAMTALVGKDECFDVKTVGGRAERRVARQLLAEIIEPRVEEIFGLVRRHIELSGYAELLASGAVITGGSCAMHGMAELAEDVLRLPVRIGVPQRIGGLSELVRKPMYATGVGLVKYGLMQHAYHRAQARRRGPIAFVKHRVSRWLGDVF